MRRNAIALIALCALLRGIVTACAAGNESGERNGVSCGPRCVAIAALLCDDRQLSDAELATAFNGSLSGTHSLDDLKAAAQSLGYSTRLVRIDPKAPRLRPQPSIVLMDSPEHAENHFVVLYGSRDGKIQVVDFPHSARWLSAGELSGAWDGWALYIANDVMSLWTVGDVVVRICDFLLLILSLCLLFFSVRRLIDARPAEKAP